ncbi:E3 ubiquitin-protein ligase RMND5A-like [Biomphalaria glabrata]|uniref:E3 ubiquitin-protein ligase RMND5A-like n=1 Tax=Biomphalaria glabrata TaxID=6526 RepID=A0A9U8EN39_BIOGL|nr:E3 ubiquitin-protein ligase RMND5A-like [Biomphalaria glabrata]KAI8777676.1 protein RMD5 A [Biomphalaria glabrata]
MDACWAVDKELERLFEKYSSATDRTQKTLDDFIASLRSFINELSERTSDELITEGARASVVEFIDRAKSVSNSVSTCHKDLHGSVSKLGKTIDRNFTSDFSSVITEGAFDGEWRQTLLNEVICEHFLRQGMLDIAESLNEDASLELSQERKEPFLELHRILEALRQHILEPALDWAERNRDELNRKKSPLEFKLHRLRFIELIKHGSMKQIEVLQYAKKLAPFAELHTKDMQLLMGSLLYLNNGIENSTYSFLFEDSSWIEICDIFTRDACGLLGLSVESPLSVGINAGCKALPPLLSIRQVMQSRQVAGVWSSKEELPVEIDLGQDYRFHSIFACPILRQQSTEQNPPMRLTCGHVISKEALHKLVVGNTNRFKCPYCPVEMTTAETKQIYF